MARPSPGRQRGPRRPSDRPPASRPRAAASSHAAASSVADLVRAPLRAQGIDLEGVVVTRAGSRHVVAVALDRDGGLDLDAIAAASRVVSELLDAHEDALPVALRGAYTLEVSSRGATAPLTAPRHWRRAVGRLVEVRRRSGVPVTGRVLEADDAGADLEHGGHTVRIAYDDVVAASVQLEFRRADSDPESSADDGPDDADELDEEDA